MKGINDLSNGIIDKRGSLPLGVFSLSNWTLAGYNVHHDFVLSSYLIRFHFHSHHSVNACLAPACSVDGKHVITIEGIGNTKNPHPVQEVIAKANGRYVAPLMIVFDMSYAF